VIDPDDPEVARSLQEAAARVETIRAELVDAFPALRGTLAISGMLVGHGLGHFVANGMTDDQIVAQVLSITAEIRRTLGQIQPAS
jgi:hypothetical protein